MPTVSVIVCVYKAGENVYPTFRSILAQTCSDFELIVIDDASNDGATSAIVNNLDDPRINLYVNEQNKGIAWSRNLGIEVAKGKYIAHCDHDDIWEPTKLQKQIAFLEEHPAYGLVSTLLAKYRRGNIIAEESHLHDMASPNEIRWSLLLDSTFAHSAVMYRASVVATYGLKYSSAYMFADDWDFFLNISKGSDIAIIPEKLTQYHLHDKNWSIRAAGAMIESGRKLFFKELNYWLDKDITEEQAGLYFSVFVSEWPCKQHKELLEAGNILYRLYEAFELRMNPSEIEKKHIQRLAAIHWWKAVRNTANQNGPHILMVYKGKQTPHWLKISLPFTLRAIVVSIIKSIQFWKKPPYPS